MSSAQIALDWTVGIPTYNRYYFLMNALSSVRNQYYTPAQVIITDNYSSDETANLCNLELGKNITYVRHERPLAILENFKSSLEICSTEYFSWLQDDDYIYSKMSQMLLPIMREDPSCACAIGYALHSRDINRVRVMQVSMWGPPPFAMEFDTCRPFNVPRYCLLPWLLFYEPGFSPVAIFKTEALQNAIKMLPSLDGFSWLLFERYLISALNTLGSITYLPAPLGVLRQHEENATKRFDRFANSEKHLARQNLASFISGLMPQALAEVEMFFTDNIVSFDADEVLRMQYILSCYDSPLLAMIQQWIQNTGCSSLKYSSLSGNRTTGKRLLFTQVLKQIIAKLKL
jgi:hypothetical protein